MKLALGSDHAGVETKDRLVASLRAAGHEVDDCGCQGGESVDYPEFAARVGRRVADGRAERGVLVCGTGIGMSIAANKLPGIRAAKVNDPEEARLCRAHNDANVLCLGSRILDPGVLQQLVGVFLEQPFEGGRHARRVEEISALERQPAP